VKIYLAGKVGQNDWRHDLVPGLRGLGDLYESIPNVERFPVLEGAVLGKHDYTGPYFVSCDHSCYHGRTSHGVGAWNDGESEVEFADEGAEEWDDYRGCGPDGPHRDRVVALCLDAIRRSDLVFAWIDRDDCFGTLAELGYARAYGRTVWIAGPKPFRELWFVYEMADRSLFFTPIVDAGDALASMLDRESPGWKRIPEREARR
jgi:hypothetical protein